MSIIGLASIAVLAGVVIFLVAVLISVGAALFGGVLAVAFALLWAVGLL